MSKFQEWTFAEMQGEVIWQIIFFVVTDISNINKTFFKMNANDGFHLFLKNSVI